jgi:hypothetical protein
MGDGDLQCTHHPIPPWSHASPPDTSLVPRLDWFVGTPCHEPIRRGAGSAKLRARSLLALHAAHLGRGAAAGHRGGLSRAPNVRFNTARTRTSRASAPA